MSMALRVSGNAPNEVTAPPANLRAYEEWRKADTLRAPYQVGPEFLRGIRVDGVEGHLECPLLCFVNARSGGQMGSQLALLLSQAIGRVQVFDIGEKDHRPDRVLSRFYDNLRVMEAGGDAMAAVMRQRLRLLVCGGDGTIAWVLGVIKKLKLSPEPPVAIMPMGTGNDLSRSFLWGPAYSHGWIKTHEAMYQTLNRVATAREDRLDCWHITVTTPRKGMFVHGTPHSLSPPAPAAAASGPLTLSPPGGRVSGLPQSFPGGPGAGPSAPGSVVGAGYGRGHSSSLAGGDRTAQAAVHPAVQAARDTSAAGERSVAASVVATLGSATPLHNIATSSVGSAATTFTTATNMSLHTGAAQAGTSIPTIVSGAVSNSAEEDGGIGVLTGMFWNYFSVGLDAKAAWSFHSLREERPALTSSRLANQFWYSLFSCTSGWFCCAQPLNVKATLEVLRPGPAGESAGWQPVKLPYNVKALVVLNLQSYAGGRNLWGPRTTAAAEKKHGFKKPSYHDGLLEVVGLCSGWHTSVVMASKGSLVHARRVCQAAGVRIAVHAPYERNDGEPSHCYMQVDGEPWKQDIPIKGREAPVRIEIVHAGVSRVLRNEDGGRSVSDVSRVKLSTAGGAGAGAGAAGASTTLNPIVSAVPEPGPPSVHFSASLPLSPSQSSVQMGALQQHSHAPAPSPSNASGSLPGALSGPGGIGAPAVITAGGAIASGGGGGGAAGHGGGGVGAGGGVAVAPQGTSAWSRLGSGGRPSAASVAGSSSVAGEPAGGGGDAGSTTRTGPVAGSKQGDGASIDAASPTPRTLSENLGSGAQSISAEGAV
ncbi:hypothetical protein HYH03_008464 [Edaphochlamys debaryana]|uniref:Diacylglycerol kinase n=1 Tax=Edaphochlamys debaryana TaxID=47281 RepID=A0A836BZF8_9CHLO|nr:hypothetical protein HYH03_008464 [Edaphochlamys debaryana]|eukprot:KAG2493329.1 hypothetical protein HYH03_008464 [Edaphochlamys debaryana]